MMKKKMTAVLSSLVLSNTFSVLSYGETSAKQEILSSSNEDNAKTNNEINRSNNVKNRGEIYITRQMATIFYIIKFYVLEDIQINTDKFNALYEYNSCTSNFADKMDSNLKTYLETIIKTALKLEELVLLDTISTEFIPMFFCWKDPCSEDPCTIGVNYNMRFTDSEKKTFSLQKRVCFHRNAKI